MLKKPLKKQNYMFKKGVKFYQLFIGPLLGHHCRFYPSCSEYSLLALDKYGTLKAFYLTSWRILRCNPFNKGGIDLP